MLCGMRDSPGLIYFFLLGSGSLGFAPKPNNAGRRLYSTLFREMITQVSVAEQKDKHGTLN